MNATFSDLAHLVQIRNHLNGLVDSISIRLTKEEVKAVQARVSLLDKTIIQKSLAMQVVIDEMRPLPTTTIVATEDVDATMRKMFVKAKSSQSEQEIKMPVKTSSQKSGTKVKPVSVSNE